MAFPTINAQQELNNRKILEDLQHKKQQIIQKGVSPIVASFQNIPVNNMPLVQVNAPLIQGLSQQIPSDIALNTPGNNLARAAWTLANSQSFGFFVTTDSVCGNNILPVLPRFDQNPPAK